MGGVSSTNSGSSVDFSKFRGASVNDMIERFLNDRLNKVQSQVMDIIKKLEEGNGKKDESNSASTENIEVSEEDINAQLGAAQDLIDGGGSNSVLEEQIATLEQEIEDLEFQKDLDGPTLSDGYQKDIDAKKREIEEKKLLLEIRNLEEGGRAMTLQEIIGNNAGGVQSYNIDLDSLAVHEEFQVKVDEKKRELAELLAKHEKAEAAESGSGSEELTLNEDLLKQKLSELKNEYQQLLSATVNIQQSSMGWGHVFGG